MGLFKQNKKSSDSASGVGEYVAPQETPAPAASVPSAPEPQTEGDVENQGQAKDSNDAMPERDSMDKQSKQEGVSSRHQRTIGISLGDSETLTQYSFPPTVKSNTSEDTKDTAFTITKNGQYLTLNGFANGHLMRWKFAAEEGPAILRFPAILAALAVIGTTLYPLVMDSADWEFWTLTHLICAFHTCFFSLLIVVLEGRLCCGIRGPTSARARVRTAITRYLNLFRLVWGRGFLYIFVGSLNLTLESEYTMYSAAAIIFLGLLSIGAGAHASYNLDKMRASLTDEAYLWSKFDACDYDKDNNLDLDGFAELLWSLGLEFDDAYTYKTFNQIDRDQDKKISFEQFRDWWIVTQITSSR